MKIMLMGDLCPKENTNELFKQKDINTLFGDFLPLFEGNDINFVNVECALTESDGAIEKFGPCLKGTPIAAEVMKEVGINLAGLSNNHIFDYGIQGYKDTVEALDKAGIAHTGFGEDYEDSRKIITLKKTAKKWLLFVFASMNILTRSMTVWAHVHMTATTPLLTYVKPRRMPIRLL